MHIYNLHIIMSNKKKEAFSVDPGTTNLGLSIVNAKLKNLNNCKSYSVPWLSVWDLSNGEKKTPLINILNNLITRLNNSKYIKYVLKNNVKYIVR